MHYLTLSLVLPPLLYTFTDSRAVSYTHGGAATVGMVMDWRDIAGRSTLERSPSLAERTSEHLRNWMPSKDSLSAAWPFLGHSDIDAHVDPQHGYNSGERLHGDSLLGGWRASVEWSSQVQSNPNKRTLSPSSVTPTNITPLLSRDEDEVLSPLASPIIRDSLRSWIISIGWLLASAVECVYMLRFCK